MKAHRPLWLAISTICALSTAAAAAEPSSYLPDTTVLLRVGDRVTRAKDLVEAYYGSWPEYRPPRDSVGRQLYLQQYLNKELMAVIALRNPPPMGFEDRLVLRQHAQRVLSNVLFQRMVLDSAEATPAEIAALRRNYSLEKKLEHIVLPDLATAKQVYQDLIAKRIGWEQARKKHAIGGKPPEAIWVNRARLDKIEAAEYFDLAPGEISEPVRATDGYHLVRERERRPTKPPDYSTYDAVLRAEIRTSKQGVRMDRFQREMSLLAGLEFDEANIEWAAKFFPTKSNVPGTTQIGVGGRLPNFAPEDTGRVLARWKGGQISLVQFMTEYKATHAYLRSPVNTPSLLKEKVEAQALLPFRQQRALELGLDKDPLTLRMIDKKREAMLVERLYHDSIETQVRVTEAQRRKYYDDHVTQYITYPRATFVAISAESKAHEDSLIARLRRGEKAEAILASDSIRHGHSVGGVNQYTTESEGQPFYKMVMEELKPGQVGSEMAPDGRRWVVQLLAYDSGHQLSYDKAAAMVAEAVANQEAEKLLKAFLARHRRGIPVEVHADRIQRVDFSDPLDKTPEAAAARE